MVLQVYKPKQKLIFLDVNKEYGIGLIMIMILHGHQERVDGEILALVVKNIL